MIFVPGQKVRATRDLYADADDCHPHRRVATHGDLLIVHSEASGAWAANVAHLGEVDFFAVDADEIEPIDEPTEFCDG